MSAVPQSEAVDHPFPSCANFFGAEPRKYSQYYSLVYGLALVSYFSIGCEQNVNTDANNPNRSELVNAALYVVDNAADQYHQSSVALCNDTAREKLYILAGKSCGCLTCELQGKLLKIGDKITVAPRSCEHVTVRNRLAYLDGYYSNSVFFKTDDDPAYRLAFESSYAVVKRLLLSPAAFVFEPAADSSGFTASAEVKFRRAERMSTRVNINNAPPWMRWQAQCIATDVQQNLSVGGTTFYEDKWNVVLRIDLTDTNAAGLAPDGRLRISIVDSAEKRLAVESFAYNAESVLTAAKGDVGTPYDTQNLSAR
jgi:hypothetical protein